MRRATAACIALAIMISSAASASPRRDAKNKKDTRAEYLSRLPQAQVNAQPASPGSLWVTGSGLTNLSTDYKGQRVGDNVIIEIVEQTTASTDGSVSTERKFSANSGIDAIAGNIHPTGLQQLFSPHSDAKLDGQGKAAANSLLRTRMAGQIVAIAAGGTLVIEAQRDVTIHNQRQTVVLRGVARPGDVSPDNIVTSTALSNLELEVKGKGVISDATRPPNFIVRMLLRLVGF